MQKILSIGFVGKPNQPMTTRIYHHETVSAPQGFVPGRTIGQGHVLRVYRNVDVWRLTHHTPRDERFDGQV